MHSSELSLDRSKVSPEMDERLAIKLLSSSKSKRYYWTNMAGICLGILCIMTGYNVLFFIQSSLHSKGGLGSMTLAVDYTVQVVTCLFLPPLLMRTIGCKWSLVFSGVTVAIFIVTNLEGTFESLMPGAVFLGIGYSTMWATMNTVVSDLATGYARLTGRSEATTLAQFFSIFFSFVNMSTIWSNIVSSQILSSQVMITDDNSSTLHHACGAQYCDMDQTLPNTANSFVNTTQPKEVPFSEVVDLVIAAVSFVGMGIILVLVLLHTYQPKEHENSESRLDVLLATIKLLRNPNLLLLISATINSGLMFSFNSADFTKAFVTCSIGIHNVGWVVSSFGITMTAGAVVLIFVTPFIPRPALFLGAFVLNLADLILMLCWTPGPGTLYVLFIISGIWGLTFSVWVAQLCALYGDVFLGNHQEAFSNHRIWDCVGFVIGFAWSYYLCMYIKIYLIIGSLVTGTVGYVLVERRLARCRQLTSDA